MLIAIIGESCTGKSTLADKINESFNAKIYSGKDYVRLSKNENDAKQQFKTILEEAGQNVSNLIYVISEKEHLEFLPKEAIKVLITADIEVIKERFSRRMNGHLPKPVAMMLEKKHGMFQDIDHDYAFSIQDENIDLISEQILEAII